MGRWVRGGWGAAAGAVVLSCNLVNGATDLTVGNGDGGGGNGTSGGSGGAGDAATSLDGSNQADGTSPGTDAASDGPAGPPMCTGADPTMLLGAAKVLAPTITELTPATNNLAGAMVSPTPVAFDAFDVSLSYSLTHASTVPAAGFAVFAIAAPPASLACVPGPNLCTLGSAAPGFAIILRTSKGNNGDPPVPYVAVVDAISYPGAAPTGMMLIDTALASTSVASISPGPPAAALFHFMTIAVRAGTVTVTIDGGAVLTKAPIPGYAAGRTGTWGISASTGLGANFASRTVIATPLFTCR